MSEVRTITNGVSGLRAKVRGLLQGLEAEIHLVLDVLLPAARVIDAEGIGCKIAVESR